MICSKAPTKTFVKILITIREEKSKTSLQSINHKMMKKKAYRYKINLHFLFLTAICHKGGKFLEIRGFFSIFFAGINFRGFSKIEYFAGTNFGDFRQKPLGARKLVPLRYNQALPSKPCSWRQLD